MKKVQLSDRFAEHAFVNLAKKEKNTRLKTRYLVLSYIQASKTVMESSALAYVSSRMVHRWLKRLSAEGLDGLRDKPGRGRKRIVSSDMCESLKQHISLELHKSKKKFITGLELRDLLRDTYNIECTMPTIYSTLERLSFPAYAKNK